MLYINQGADRGSSGRGAIFFRSIKLIFAGIQKTLKNLLWKNFLRFRQIVKNQFKNDIFEIFWKILTKKLRLFGAISPWILAFQI